MKLCDYCGVRKGKYQFKNGKWCCEEVPQKCPAVKEKNSKSNKSQNNPNYGKSGYWLGKKLTEDHKNKCGLKRNKHPNYGKYFSEETKKKISDGCRGRTPWNKGKHLPKELVERMKLTIEQIHNKYPFFSKIEEMRYNRRGEIQVHCKNHNCINSKEKNGWFTPTRQKLIDRIRALEKPEGFGESNFYCSEECKEQCPIYDFHLYSNNKQFLYTHHEYETFRQEVLKRDNYKCLYCGKPAEHVHHIRPQKLEPFFALDPDYAISVCKECHYKYGHKDKCSTGNLATKIC